MKQTGITLGAAILMVILVTTALIIPVAGQEKSGAPELRRHVVSFTGDGAVISDQGTMYQARASAGEVVAVSSLGAETVSGSIGFWWLLSGEPQLPVTDDPPIFLPVILK